MRKESRGLVAAGLAAAIAMFGQTPAPKLEFEVASIKPAPPFSPAMMQAGKMHLGMNIDGARVDIGGMPIVALLPQAFRVKQYQVVGASVPEIMNVNGERWDILAKLPEGATQEQIPDMLLSLLVDRFKMTYHRETRQLSVYGLIVGKNGTKLKDVSAEPDAPFPEGPNTVSMNNGSGPVRINQDGGGRGGGFGPGRGKSATITSLNSDR